MKPFKMYFPPFVLSLTIYFCAWIMLFTSAQCGGPSCKPDHVCFFAWLPTFFSFFFLMWEYLVLCTVVCVEPKILHILLSVWDLDFLPTVVFGFNRILVGLGSLPSNPRECISTSSSSIRRRKGSFWMKIKDDTGLQYSS